VRLIRVDGEWVRFEPSPYTVGVEEEAEEPYYNPTIDTTLFSREEKEKLHLLHRLAVC
jgi:hypothetical protein